MELVARRVHQMQGAIMPTWFKKWMLEDVAGTRYGTMLWNDSWNHHKFSVNIHHPVHEDLGVVAHAQFDDRGEALAWARAQIEQQKPVTREDLQALLVRIVDSRYQDEMSDDFAYTNGKIARWDRMVALVRAEIHKLEHK